MKKKFLFLVVLLHAFPTTLFLNGEPFYARERFGWGLGANAGTQAMIGLCIAFGSFAGGKIAHRTRPRRAILLGLVGSLFSALIGYAGSFTAGPFWLILSLACLSFTQVLAWPGIEAALMEGETQEQVQNLVGIFNLLWSAATATALLVSTFLLVHLGSRVFFVLPAAFFLINLVFLLRLIPDREEQGSGMGEEIEGKREDGRENKECSRPVIGPIENSQRLNTLTPAQRAVFRWMGWIANPFSYIAINVIVTYNPITQARLGLDLAYAGLWFSLWLYIRMVTFELLRRWSWWHYRRGFLCGAFGIAMVGFLGITLAPSWAILLAAQIGFGLSVGLLYQSSLFYSMAGSEAQGEHGAAHEAFIGVGQMIGPLIAFGGAQLAPHNPALPVWLVLAMMTVGLGALITVAFSPHGRAASR